MKVAIFFSLLVVAISASISEELGAKFQAFKLEHGKTYLNQAEESKRFNIFTDNVRAIEAHNALYEQGKVSYKKGINKFTDMSQEEFKTMLTLSASRKPTLETTSYVKTGVEIPSSVDWRKEGRVTGVKDQGDCGSCWAFSITGSTEGAYARKSGKLVSLSEQQLIDCCTDTSAGCDGGSLDDNFKYVMKDGLQSEESYTYKGEDGACKYNVASVVTKVSKYTSIPAEDEDALLEAVATVGPVSVGMDASYLSSYDSGIYEDQDCSPAGLNHAILAVGYGTENGKDYWIIKNSWGASWGEQGYFRLARGKNQCGISEDTVYPTID
uniref:Cysteine proteinase n=1 Tax=Hypera postica TaxID=36757 RepID=Q9Y0D2_9CUCU|nr:cysteine proteinase [Hypera postica]